MKGIRGARIAVVGMVALAACASPREEGEPSSEDRIDGALTTRMRGRSGGGARDLDAYAVLALDAGDAARDGFGVHVLAQTAVDLDRESDFEDEFVFYSLDDTYDSSVTARLDHAYVDLDASRELSRLRLGRQLDVRTPVLSYFDGIALETPRVLGREVLLGAYGGVPVHPYESSPEGDLIAGLYAEARPWERGHLRLDWMHLEDEGQLGAANDDLLALAVDQGLGERVVVEAAHSRLEGDARDARGALRYADPGTGLAFDASYYELFEPQGDLSEALDPFTATLLELFPYTRATLLVSRPFGAHVDVQGGIDVRRVSRDDDVGEFNRDFERVFGTLSCSNARGRETGTTLALTGERWDGTDTEIATWGVDLERRFDEKTRASLGSFYSLYKYDFYLDQERDEVRTWFGRFRRTIAAGLELDLRYEFERDDFDDFHTLRMATTWRF